MTLEELRKLEAAATPGPWDYGHRSGDDPTNNSEWGRNGFWLGNKCFWGTPESWRDGWDEPSEENAALIAAMRNALPDLIAAVECLRQMSDEASTVVLSKTQVQAFAILKRLGVE